MRIARIAFFAGVSLLSVCGRGVDYHVDPLHGDDANDGSAPARAKRTLAGAMSIARLVPGDVVHAAPGTYDAGGMWDGCLTNRVTVPAGVGLDATGGASVTFIRGASDPSAADGIGPAAVRCVRMGSGAWIRGFTVADGRTARKLVGKEIPLAGPYVRFEGVSGAAGRSVIRRTADGRGLLVGGSGAGVSHALTVVLESLGCRYLWPGKTGKVIPRGRARVVAPEIELDRAPTLLSRGMRGTQADKTNCLDRAGNRGFYAWHGINDTAEKSWARGHYYKTYYETYAAEHPDWFALQPNGSRVLNLGDMPDRPTFCLANRELAAQVASNRVAVFFVFMS